MIQLVERLVGGDIDVHDVLLTPGIGEAFRRELPLLVKYIQSAEHGQELVALALNPAIRTEANYRELSTMAVYVLSTPILDGCPSGNAALKEFVQCPPPGLDEEISGHFEAIFLAGLRRIGGGFLPSGTGDFLVSQLAWGGFRSVFVEAAKTCPVELGLLSVVGKVVDHLGSLSTAAALLEIVEQSEAARDILRTDAMVQGLLAVAESGRAELASRCLAVLSFLRDPVLHDTCLAQAYPRFAGRMRDAASPWIVRVFRRIPADAVDLIIAPQANSLLCRAIVEVVKETRFEVSSADIVKLAAAIGDPTRRFGDALEFVGAVSGKGEDWEGLQLRAEERRKALFTEFVIHSSDDEEIVPEDDGMEGSLSCEVLDDVVRPRRASMFDGIEGQVRRRRCTDCDVEPVESDQVVQDVPRVRRAATEVCDELPLSDLPRDDSVRPRSRRSAVDGPIELPIEGGSEGTVSPRSGRSASSTGCIAIANDFALEGEMRRAQRSTTDCIAEEVLWDGSVSPRSRRCATDWDGPDQRADGCLPGGEPYHRGRRQAVALDEGPDGI